MQYWWLVSKHREVAAKGARTHTHTHTHTHRQTHICSVTSSVLLSAEQMQGPARQLVACDDFLWALYGGSSWVHPGLEDSDKMCEQEHQKCTHLVYVCTCACACCSAVSHFSLTYRVSSERKRKKEHCLKNPKPRHRHPLGITKHTNLTKQTEGMVAPLVAKQDLFSVAFFKYQFHTLP